MDYEPNVHTGYRLKKQRVTKNHQKIIPVGVESSKSHFGAIFEPSRGPKKVFWGSFKTMNLMSIMDIDLGSKESLITTQKIIPVGVEISKLSIWANFEPS